VQKVKLSTGKIHKHSTNLVQVPTKLAQSVPFFSKKQVGTFLKFA